MARLISDSCWRARTRYLPGLILALTAVALVLCSITPLAAAETTWSLEFKGRYRSSDDASFAVGFPFTPEMIPLGQEFVSLRTVDPGDAIELVAVTLALETEWQRWAFGLKVVGVDLDDRNPTSSGREIDIDELWLRFGDEAEPATLADSSGFYFKIGKFPHFERQDDRHLESYGLATTAFNRMEDVGAELGVDLGRYLYLKASYSQGNPLFMRDTNALAGDNGTPELRIPYPDPVFNSGVVIPYDADVQDVDFDRPELAFGLGLRLADATGDRGAELLLWTTERDLAQTVDIDGSFYGGDLDLLRGPFDSAPFPVTSGDKQEDGATFWLYWDGLSLFAQSVDQDLAGLPRTGIEAELAWRWQLPPGELG